MTCGEVGDWGSTVSFKAKFASVWIEWSSVNSPINWLLAEWLLLMLSIPCHNLLHTHRYTLFYRVGSLWHASSRTCVISRRKVSVRPLPNADFLSSDWLMMLCKGQPFSFGKKNFSNIVVTSHSSCVFLYLFSSANVLLVRFVLHLQDWWCVGKRETSFPVNKLWLIYLPPSLWPSTMKNRYACKF